MCVHHVWPPGGEEWAAVGVLLNGDKVLLIKRVERDGDPWSGQVAFPGGRWRPGEDLLDTAKREVEEETGLRPLGLFGVLESLSPSNAPWLKVVPFLFTKWVGVLKANPKEVQEARWVSRSELVEWQWGGRHAFRAGDWVVWGLTYRILKKLLECNVL
ncbi:MAG: NUDIX hydrolase [Pyrobaculum sp.]